MPLTDNDVTRMSRHQLAQRIEQMEATAHRNSTTGALNDRHRPMEDRRRREKIALYQEELERRERADAQAKANEQRIEERAAQQSARDLNRNARDLNRNARNQQPAELPQVPASIPAAACDHCEGTGSITLATSAAYTARGCGECQGTGIAPPIPQPPAPAAGKGEQMNVRDFRDWQEPDDADKWDREREATNQAAIAAERTDRAAEINHGTDHPTPVVVLQPRITTPPPPLTVECPQCHSTIGAPCRNYKGQQCAPHGARAKLAQLRSPEARKAKHDAEQASKERAATVATAHEISQAAVAPPRPTSTPATCPPLRTMDVSCPRCGARIGQPCHQRNGRPTIQEHAARERLAAELQQPAELPQVPASIPAAPPSVPIEKCTIAEKCSHLHADGQQCSKNASTAHYETGAPLCQQHAREARRTAAAIAPARMDEAKPNPAEAARADARDEDPLIAALLPLLRQHGTPAVLDATWTAARRLHPRPAGYGAGC